MQKPRQGHPRLRVGLTGGVASGKSAIADMFAARGVPVIDTDEIAREVVAPGQPGLQKIVAAFGRQILLEDGTLDRAGLRKTVFADPEQRATLESILHPLIRSATLEKADQADGPYQLIVVPLLVETDFSALVNRVLVVDCPEELARERLIARDDESAETADNIIRAQVSRATRLAHADDVIENKGTLADADQAVADLHAAYLQLAAAEHPANDQ